MTESVHDSLIHFEKDFKAYCRFFKMNRSQLWILT